MGDSPGKNLLSGISIKYCSGKWASAPLRRLPTSSSCHRMNGVSPPSLLSLPSPPRLTSTFKMFRKSENIWSGHYGRLASGGASSENGEIKVLGLILRVANLKVYFCFPNLYCIHWVISDTAIYFQQYIHLIWKEELNELSNRWVGGWLCSLVPFMAPFMPTKDSHGPIR